ncbi:MAG: YcxB family protein [Anaerostipes sp.]|jgi:hypothetical protein
MKFKFKLDVNDLFRFSLIHSYTGSGGFFSAIVGIIGIVMIVQGVALGAGITKAIVGLVMLALFFGLNPAMLYLKTKRQAESNMMYQTETECEFDEKGMHIHIGEQNGGILWSEVQKVQYLAGLYMLYTGPKTAFVFNEKKLGDEAQNIMNYIYSHVGPHVKLPKGAVRK